jgi:hypothetical protein
LAWRFLTAHRRSAPNQSSDCIPQVIFGEVGVTQGRFNSLVAHEHLHGAGCAPSPAGWQRGGADADAPNPVCSNQASATKVSSLPITSVNPATIRIIDFHR